MLLLHGLASDARELGHLPEAIADQGFSVLALDLRGHGASEGLRGLVTRNRVLAELTAWRYHLSERGVRLAAVGGHSLGGTWALSSASLLPVRAAFAVAPPATLTAEINAFELAGYRLGQGIHALASRLGRSDLRVPYKYKPRHIHDDPATIEAMEREGFLVSTLPMALAESALAIDATRWVGEAKVPALIAICKRDRVVSHENSQRLYDAYGGPKTWLELDAPHSAFFGVPGIGPSQQVAAWLGGTL